MAKLKLGIIGLSEGNGHPYSWSAIINGFNKDLMMDCGFPAIPDYLGQQNFPKDQIKNAEVSHIYTQDINLSKKIARTTFIQKVCSDYKEMIGEIDGLLLARDDANNHKKYAEPFLRAGIPIYIDKPMALSVDEANILFSMQKYEGQIFSCSALSYANELKINKNDFDKIGQLLSIKAKTPKDWDKYAIHLIDPIIRMPITIDNLIKSNLNIKKNITRLELINKEGIIILIQSDKESSGPIEINLHGINGDIKLTFIDSFNAFKSALEDFIDGILTNEVKTKKASILEAISILEMGRIK